MSSDASPPSGIRLEADPPWSKVLATTLRLWLRRRVLRVPDHRRVSRGRLAAAWLAILLVGAVAGGAVVVLGGPHSVAARHRGARPARHVITPPPPSPVQAEATVNAQDAAAWVAAQVGAQTPVGCDVATCADLAAAGFRTDATLSSQPALSQPALSQQAIDQSAGLPGSMTLLVVTPALRATYGGQVAATAPVVVASFGSGQAAVQVREFVPGGVAAYQHAAGSALVARRTAGHRLILNRQVFVHGAARQALTSGRVDPRLIALLRAIAVRYPVHIARFGDSGPQAGHAAPLRMAEIGGFGGERSTVRASHRGELTAIRKLLGGERGQYRAKLIVTRLAGGATMLKIEVLAPAPI